MGSQHYDTAPEDRIPFSQMVVYGLGAFVNNMLAAASGGMMIILTVGFGLKPSWVGLLGSIPRFTDAITDPLMGYISDHTRSRWGRRRPYIFVGAVLSGLAFILLWQLPSGDGPSLKTFVFYYFLGVSILFFLGYTIFATPWVALGYELTPDYHERTRLMGVQNFIGQLAYLISPWFLWFAELEYFGDIRNGAWVLALLVGVGCMGLGILPALMLKERGAIKANPIASKGLAHAPSTPAKPKVSLVDSLVDFFKGFAATFMFPPFQKLCIATFLVFNGFILISSFQPFVIIYYVFGGDTKLGGEYVGYFGTLTAVSALPVVAIVTQLATRVGKRKAFYLSTGISIIGYGLKWFCYNPESPFLLLLPAPLMAFGLGGLFTLMPSMTADVVDLDELETHERREGMFGAIYWWVVKVGMAAALAGGGYLLDFTGFDVDLKGAQTEATIFWMRVIDVSVPMVASAIAIFVISSYPISEAKAHEIRGQLAEARGEAGAGQ